MFSLKETNKLIKNVLRAMPAIPYFAPKKTSSIFPMILGGVAVAIAGGIAAVMIMSPRTRVRALDVAKDGLGKARAQLDDLGISEKLGLAQVDEDRNTTPNGYSNGLVGKDSAAFSPSGGV